MCGCGCGCGGCGSRRIMDATYYVCMIVVDILLRYVDGTFSAP